MINDYIVCVVATRCHVMLKSGTDVSNLFCVHTKKRAVCYDNAV